jgi:hypothetical protein
MRSYIVHGLLGCVVHAVMWQDTNVAASITLKMEAARFSKHWYPTILLHGVKTQKKTT